MAGAETARTVRFAWWGAEELGLVGADSYVTNLPEPERARISAYLNFDMVGSPNAVRFVYDGDDSDAVGAPAGPEGSAAIEHVFEEFYDDRGLTHEGTDFNGRSDYGPFIAAGIPAGGLFTGAEGVKTPEQAQRHGGTAGEPYDPCYHAVCDTFDNVDTAVLDQNADAMAYAHAHAREVQERALRGRQPQGGARQGAGEEVRRHPRRTLVASLDPLSPHAGDERVEPVLQHEQLEVATGTVERRARRERA